MACCMSVMLRCMVAALSSICCIAASWRAASPVGLRSRSWSGSWSLSRPARAIRVSVCANKGSWPCPGVDAALRVCSEQGRCTAAVPGDQQHVLLHCAATTHVRERSQEDLVWPHSAAPLSSFIGANAYQQRLPLFVQDALDAYAAAPLLTLEP